MGLVTSAHPNQEKPMSKTDVKQIVQETVKQFETLCTNFVQQTEAATRQQVMSQLPQLLGQVQQTLGATPVKAKTNGSSATKPTKAKATKAKKGSEQKKKRVLSPEGKAALAKNLEKARAAKAAKEEATRLAAEKAEKDKAKAAKKRSEAQKRAWKTRKANQAANDGKKKTSKKTK